MAVRMNCLVQHVEFRGIRKYVGKKSGKEGYSLNFEDSDGNVCSISVNDPELFFAAGSLRKGNFYDVPVFVNATSNYQYAALIAPPIDLGQGDDDELAEQTSTMNLGY